MAPTNTALVTQQDQTPPTDWAAAAAKFGGTVVAPPSSSTPAVASDPDAPSADKPPVAKAPGDTTQKMTQVASQKDWEAAAAKFGGKVVTPEEPGFLGRLVGPDTALRADAPKPIQNEMSGVSDILHGDIAKGAGKIWDSEKPHVIPGSPLEKLIQKVNPSFKGEGGDPSQSLVHEVGDKPILNIQDALKIDKKQHPIERAIAETASSFTSPNTVAMMAATGGMGLVEFPQALGMANRLISAGFSGQSIAAAYKGLKGFKEAYDAGDGSEAEYQLTHAILSGSMAALMAQHAVTGEGPQENAWTKARAKADTALGNAVSTAAGLPGRAAAALIPDKNAGVTPADHLEAAADNLYKAIKPGKSLVADDFRKTLNDAMPQLSVVANKNPDVSTPVEMASAIEKHRVGIEAQLKQKAADMRGLPQASMTTLADDVQNAMREGWDKSQGKFTPDEIEKAEASVMKQLGIETKMLKNPDIGPEAVPTPFRTGPIPDLFTAENIRQRFADDSKPAFNGPGNVPSAEAYAKAVANQAMRESIDQKFEDLGVDGVKEWRKQEVGLIDVRDALQDAAKRSEDAGKWSAWKSLIDKKGWGSMPAIAGAVLGGAPGAIVGELAHLGADWWRDQQTNPNVLTSKALEHFQQAGISPEAKLPTKTATPAPKVTPIATEVPKVIEEPDAIEQHIDDEVEKRMLAHREDGEGPKLPEDELRLKYRQEVRKEMGLPPEPKEVEEEEGESANPTRGAAAANAAPEKNFLKGLFEIKRSPKEILEDVHHELGHAIVGAEGGMGVSDGILSHRHPNNLKIKAIAAMPMEYPREWFDAKGNLHPDNSIPHIGDFLAMLMGGGAAEEHLSGIPMEKNRGMYGDLRIARDNLKELGYPPQQIEELIEGAKNKAREVLTRPNVSDIVKKYSSQREENLPDVFHMSKERVKQIVKEIKDGQNKERESGGNAGANGARVPEVNKDVDRGTESRSEGPVGQEPGEEVDYEHNYHEDAEGNVVHVPKTGEKKGLGLGTALAGTAALGGLAGLAGIKHVESQQQPQGMYFPGAMTPVHRVSAHREKNFDVPTLLDKASQEHNVPTLLTRAQARQESGFNQGAVSNKGATGVMQLMPRTASELGVDPHDTEQNIYGGVRLMSQLHNRFGHWDRALSAYNWSPDKTQEVIDRYGDHWLEHTPKETQAYVKKIMSEYSRAK